MYEFMSYIGKKNKTALLLFSMYELMSYIGKKNKMGVFLASRVKTGGFSALN